MQVKGVGQQLPALQVRGGGMGRGRGAYTKGVMASQGRITLFIVQARGVEIFMYMFSQSE